MKQIWLYYNKTQEIKFYFLHFQELILQSSLAQSVFSKQSAPLVWLYFGRHFFSGGPTQTLSGRHSLLFSQSPPSGMLGGGGGIGWMRVSQGHILYHDDTDSPGIGVYFFAWETVSNLVLIRYPSPSSQEWKMYSQYVREVSMFECIQATFPASGSCMAVLWLVFLIIVSNAACVVGYNPVLRRKSVIIASIVAISDIRWASRASLVNHIYAIAPMLARRATIVITTMSSVRVKPHCFFLSNHTNTLWCMVRKLAEIFFIKKEISCIACSILSDPKNANHLT